MLTEREDIAIAQLAIYIPSIFIAIYVSFRHGFVRQLGWVYLVIFGGLRTAGAAIEILSVKHPTSRTDATWAAILSSIGLSPLLLAALGLLKRVNDFIAEKSLRIRAIQLLHILCILGLILGIVGGTRLSSSDTSKQSSGQSFEKAGGLVFVAVYLSLFALAALTMANVRNLPWGEKWILIAILAALPFLAVRLLYSILADFEDNNTFNIINGNATVQLCMAVIEEFIITIFFLAAGLAAPSLKDVRSGVEEIPLNSKDLRDPGTTDYSVPAAQ